MTDDHSAKATFTAGFISVGERLPGNDKPVLIIRDSGVITCKFEICTAKYMPDFRPRNPWLDLGNQPLSDSGSQPLAWREASELF